MEGVAEEVEGGATPQLGAPYVTYGIQNKQHSIMLLARMGGAEVLRYKQVGEVVGRTKETLRTRDICTRPIILPDGSTVRHSVVTTRPTDETLMPDGWHEAYVEIPLTAGGMKSGCMLTEKWTSRVPDAGAVLAEAVAAHLVYNAANGTEYVVQFEPDAVCATTPRA